MKYGAPFRAPYFFFEVRGTEFAENTPMRDLTSDIKTNIEEISREIKQLQRDAKRRSTDPARLREIASELKRLTGRRTHLRKNLETS